MKKTAILLSSIGLSLASLHAQTVPQFINYQGTVTDSSGALVGAGGPLNRKILFRIWDSAAGTAAANRLWTEEQTVTISQGQFSVLLGQGIAGTGTAAGENRTNPSLEQVFTNSGTARYLEVTVDNGDGTFNASDTPISPRQQITTSAYSFHARAADTVTGGATTGAMTVNGIITSTAAINTSSNISATSGTVTGANLTATGTVTANAVNTVSLTASGAITGSSFSGNGAALTALNASNITSGSLAVARIADGAINNLKISDLDAAKLTGTLDNNRLSSAVAIRSAANTFSANNTFTASNNFNADQYLSANLYMDKDNILFGRNVAGGYEAAFWPRAFNTTFLNYGLNGFHIRNNSAVTTAMFMDNSGRVGINTTSPNYSLVVEGGIRAKRGTFATVPNSGYAFTDENDTGMFSNTTSAADPDGTIQFISNNSEKMRITPAGYIGINTAAPNVPLDVAGGNTLTGLGNYFQSDSGLSYGNRSLNTSIRSAAVVQASGFNAVSDARSKEVVGISDGNKDLTALGAIEITNYTYRDRLANGSQTHKKVIAQQVETVFPQAVNQSTGVVPDIFQKAVAKDGWVSLATDLKVGDRVRLIGEKGSGSVHEVLEVRPGGFRTELQPADAQVFVYGREVKDFRTVDYDAIAMLNVSATQELNRRLAAVSAESAKKDATLALLEKRLAQLETRDQAREAKVAKLEKLLGEKSDPRLVSLKAESAK